MGNGSSPESGGAWFLSGGLFAALNTYSAAIQANTLALNANSALVQQLIDKETLLMADLTALTAIASNLASVESTLAADITALEAAYQAAKAAGFTPQNQIDLDAAIAALGATHTKLQADAAAAVT
jgi:hypothetical protein